MRIDIVDDNPINRQFLLTLLRYQGYELREAQDGQRALDQIRAEGAPDMVITDIVMPHMDGGALTRALRADPETRHIPVLFYTATYRMKNARELAEETGANAVLTKPCDPEEILAVVHRFCPPPLPAVVEEPPGPSLQSYQQTALLLELGIELSAHKEVPALAAFFCRASCKILQAQEAIFGYFQGGCATLQLYSHPSPTKSERPPESYEKISSALFGQRDDNPIIALELDGPEKSGSRTIAIGLRAKKRALGWLCYSFSPQQSPEAHEERLLAALAAQLSVVLENIELLQQRERERELLQLEIITRRKAEGELALRIQELAISNGELEQFAFIISHDIKEPLRMISLYLDLLREEHGGSLNDEASEYVDISISSAKKLHKMTTDLLLFSRLGRFHEEPLWIEATDLLQSAQGLLHAQLQELDAALTWDPLPRIYGQKSKLERLFQNLLSNALRYRSPERRPEVHFSARQTEEAWEFRCTDNGIGIKEAHAGKIFGLFQRLHTQDEIPGTGMGLSICKKIVELHRGEIWVEPRPTSGVTFAFSLPRPREPGSLEA